VANYVKVATVDEIPSGKFKLCEVGFSSVLVCNTGDGFYAVESDCSHMSLPMGGGQLYKNELMCPHHAAKFDVTTGKALTAPAVAPIETYELKVEDNDISVAID
jgi:3-phenylpropionate/trans-cinnamate dioxygenase ferredoxin subunit